MTPGKVTVNDCLPAQTGLTVLAGLSLRQSEYLRQAGAEECGEHQGGEHGEW